MYFQASQVTWTIKHLNAKQCLNDMYYNEKTIVIDFVSQYCFLHCCTLLFPMVECYLAKLNIRFWKT